VVRSSIGVGRDLLPVLFGHLAWYLFPWQPSGSQDVRLLVNMCLHFIAGICKVVRGCVEFDDEVVEMLLKKLKVLLI
jgi:hypothetical protein